MNKTESMTRKSFEQYDAEHLVVYFNESEREMPAMQDGEGGQTVYEYDTVLVKGDVFSVENTKQALVEEGYDAYEAEAIAAGVMLQAVQDGTVEGDALALAKQMVIARISAYDASTEVNDLTVNGKHMWYDKVTRTSISYSMKVEKDAGETTTKLYDNDNVPYVLPIDTALGLFAQLELYAKACFNNTEAHKAAVMAKRTVNTVLAYDYTTGYPEKLSFNV